MGNPTDPNRVFTREERKALAVFKHLREFSQEYAVEWLETALNKKFHQAALFFFRNRKFLPEEELWGMLKANYYWGVYEYMGAGGREGMKRDPRYLQHISSLITKIVKAEDELNAAYEKESGIPVSIRGLPCIAPGSIEPTEGINEEKA